MGFYNEGSGDSLYKQILVECLSREAVDWAVSRLDYFGNLGFIINEACLLENEHVSNCADLNALTNNLNAMNAILSSRRGRRVYYNSDLFINAVIRSSNALTLLTGPVYGAHFNDMCNSALWFFSMFIDDAANFNFVKVNLQARSTFAANVTSMTRIAGMSTRMARVSASPEFLNAICKVGAARNIYNGSVHNNANRVAVIAAISPSNAFFNSRMVNQQFSEIITTDQAPRYYVNGNCSTLPGATSGTANTTVDNSVTLMANGSRHSSSQLLFEIRSMQNNGIAVSGANTAGNRIFLGGFDHRQAHISGVYVSQAI